MEEVLMSSLWIVVIGVVVIYFAYNYYAKRIDRTVIQADASRVTPARMYMDGADFMPTSRFVLYGYHFKSIAAAGPIVGVITAANLWGWLPAILWLMIGVSFIGWASDYSAIMMAVRNDGNSLSAIAHRLISPRTRRILFVFIFFYLLLIEALNELMAPAIGAVDQFGALPASKVAPNGPRAIAAIVSPTVRIVTAMMLIRIR